MLTVYEMNPASFTYNCPFILELKGKLNVVSLHQALMKLCARHDSMRSYLSLDSDGITTQRVIATESFEIPLACWNGAQLQFLTSADFPIIEPSKPGPAGILEWLREEAKRPFNITRGPLFRAVLARIDSMQEHLLLLCLHHAITDGHSVGIMLKELASEYTSEAKGADCVQWQYADFTSGSDAFQNRRFSSPRFSTGQNSWRIFPCFSYRPISLDHLSQQKREAVFP